MDLPNAAHRPWPLPHRPWVMAMQWHDLLFMQYHGRPAAAYAAAVRTAAAFCEAARCGGVDIGGRGGKAMTSSPWVTGGCHAQVSSTVWHEEAR
jgi:hypothetical protein